MCLQSLEDSDVEDMDSRQPRSAVGRITSVAGMAAAGLGGAAVFGGMAVDVTDIAVLAGLYGVATAVASSRSAAIRDKGAAGPLFSVIMTASDIAKKFRGKMETGVGGSGKAAEQPDPMEKLGRYAKSDLADQSGKSSGRGAAKEAAAARFAAARQRKQEDATARRAAEMQRQLGHDGLQALEDGVAQVMATDVQRILDVCFPCCACNHAKLRARMHYD